MRLDAAIPRSRRALLVGALGGVAAVVSQALGRPLGVHAGAGNDGDPMVVGGEYFDARSRTFLKNATNNDDVFVAVTSGSGKGVWGKNDGGGPGVYGQATNAGSGVQGVSGVGLGVYGTSTSNAGVWGESTDGVGVRGRSTTDRGVLGSGRTIGVEGRSDVGTGVEGTSQSGFGVYGSSERIGVYAVSQGASGFALSTHGRIDLRSSGVAIIPAGATSVGVNPNVLMTADSFALITPSVDIGARRLWYTKNVVLNELRIRLSSPRSSATRVSYLVLR
jgi:hypothetical protein